MNKYEIAVVLSVKLEDEERTAIIEKIMLWYRENGYAKERLGATVDRLGIEALEAAIASDDLLIRRDSIVAAPIKDRP